MLVLALVVLVPVVSVLLLLVFLVLAALVLPVVGNRLDTGPTFANKNRFWATVRSQKLVVVPKS